jgi:hypothetical protein
MIDLPNVSDASLRRRQPARRNAKTLGNLGCDDGAALPRVEDLLAQLRQSTARRRTRGRRPVAALLPVHDDSSDCFITPSVGG